MGGYGEDDDFTKIVFGIGCYDYFMGDVELHKFFGVWIWKSDEWFFVW